MVQDGEQALNCCWLNRTAPAFIGTRNADDTHRQVNGGGATGARNTKKPRKQAQPSSHAYAARGKQFQGKRNQVARNPNRLTACPAGDTILGTGKLIPPGPCGALPCASSSWWEQSLRTQENRTGPVLCLAGSRQFQKFSELLFHSTPVKDIACTVALMLRSAVNFREIQRSSHYSLSITALLPGC